MNPDEVFALLRRADPATDAIREDLPVTNFNPESRRPRSWVRPLAYAAAAALVVIVAIGPLGLLGGDGDVIEQPTTTVSTPTTTPATTPSTTATTTTASTTPTTIPAASGGLLIANGDAITWGDGDATPGVDVPAKVVYDDLAGGVIYQLALPGVGSDDAAAIVGSTVYHIPAGATEPQVLMAPSGSNWLLLQDVVRIDGSPTALVVERRDPTSFENATDVLFEVELTTGEQREVAVVGGWESGLSAISWDGSTYVTSSFAEAYTFVSRLDRDGTITPWEGAIPGECFDDSSCPTKVVASADGERLVMIRQGQLVEWDREADAEVQAIDLPEGIYVAPILSGDTVVLNRYSEGFDSDYGVALVVDLTDGTVTEAPNAGFADWIDGPALEVGPVEGGPDVETVPALLIDGVEQAAAGACAGADGAIVFVFDDGSRAMVGFEEGTFIRYIDAEGNVFETADVGVDESLPPVYSGEVDVAGTPMEITIVTTSGVGLPSCDEAFPLAGRVLGYMSAIEEVDGQRVVVFDQKDMLTGEEAEDAAAAAGTEVSNDYFMVDGPSGVRAPLSPDVTLTLVSADCCESVDADPERWVSMWGGTQPEWNAAGWFAPFLPYWFTIEDGVVTAIEQQYLP